MALVRAFVSDVRARYGNPDDADPPTTPAWVFDPPGGVFLIALDPSTGDAVGCVGCSRAVDPAEDYEVPGATPVEPPTADVRRMFVSPSARGRGVSRALLAELEARARALGYALMRLETGPQQPEAIALYRSAGYEDIPPHVDDADAVCLAKRL